MDVKSKQNFDFHMENIEETTQAIENKNIMEAQVTFDQYTSNCIPMSLQIPTTP